jgi:nucleoid-associated protein YgaU
MRAEVKVGLIVGAVVVAGAAIWWFRGSSNELDSLPIDKRAMDAASPGDTALVGDATVTPSRSRQTAQPMVPGPDRTVSPARPSRRTVTPPAPRDAESKLEQPPATARPSPESNVKPTSPGEHAPELVPPAGERTSLEPSAEPLTPSGGAVSERGPTGETTPPTESDVPRRRETGAPEAVPVRRSAGLPSPSAMKTYTIQRGDRLIDLAREEYGDGSLWEAIKAVNPGIDENRLVIGATIYIPAEADARRLLQAGRGQETPPPPAERADRDRPAAGRTAYVVVEGDTLIKIARDVLKDGTRWREIFELNRDKLESPDVLRVGMELRLPPSEKD